MTTDQYVLLSVLTGSEDLTQQELVKRCYSDTATIGAMLLLLEGKGIVTRTPHPRDGRALRVSLTRAGRRMAEEMRTSSSSLRAELASLFNEEEHEILIEYLSRLEGALRPPRRGTPTSRRRKIPSHTTNDSTIQTQTS
jgi:DNA-binding MarR family transcriptional regulator